jgi:hypothetical protein
MTTPLVIATQIISQPDVLVTSWVEILSITILVSLGVAAFKHFNCHVNSPRFCWRFGHPVEGTHYRACSKHHPKRPHKITAEHIARAHGEATHSTTSS